MPRAGLGLGYIFELPSYSLLYDQILSLRRHKVRVRARAPAPVEVGWVLGGPIAVSVIGCFLPCPTGLGLLSFDRVFKPRVYWLLGAEYLQFLRGMEFGKCRRLALGLLSFDRVF